MAFATRHHPFSLFLLWILLGINVPMAFGANRILVVMSYEKDFYWSQEVRRGIEQVLGKDDQARYFYMDTKIHFEGGEGKAREAFELFQSMQPDGVITVDDNAQSMFVLPYLRGRTDTPIMFCGVNATAATYGYPNEHISGILERGHIRESLAFAHQLSPAIRSVGFITFDRPSGKAVMAQVEREADSYPVSLCGTQVVASIDALDQAASRFKENCDALYMDGMGGLQDEEGRPLGYQAVFQRVSERFAGPILGANRAHVRSGALSAVIKTGEEQGRTAAEMLLKAIEQGDLTALPVTQNYRGHRIINVSTLRRFGIKPKPMALRGAELIKALPGD